MSGPNDVLLVSPLGAGDYLVTLTLARDPVAALPFRPEGACQPRYLTVRQRMGQALPEPMAFWPSVDEMREGHARIADGLRSGLTVAQAIPPELARQAEQEQAALEALRALPARAKALPTPSWRS